MLIFKGKNRITSAYQLPDRPDHNGLDIVGDDSKDVLCPVTGTVKSSTIITNKNDSTWEWGNYVRVDDKDGNRLFFCHMDSRAVKVGQTVKPGDKLGVMGNTGYSFGAHTHFEVRKPDGKTTSNPAAYLGIPNAKGIYTDEGKTGWVNEGEAWYYYENGKPVKAVWRFWDGWWYWLGDDGKMCTGLTEIQGKQYYLQEETQGNIPKGACIITNNQGEIKK